jgi:hypothetical protein
MNRRSLALTLAAAAGLWLFGLIAWPQGLLSARRLPDPSPHADAPDSSEPSAQVVLPAQPPSPARKPEAPKSAGKVAAPPGDVAQYLAWERAQFGTYFARLDELRTKEPRDAAFASAVDQLARRTMTEVEMLAGTRLVSIECGTTLCRIEAHHENELAKVRFGQVFPLKIGVLLAEGSLHTEPGSKVSVLQFARGEGQLPRFTELADNQLVTREPE